MDRKIRVGAVSYLNTKPLIYGFEQGMMKDEIELVIDYPSNIAKKLLNKEIEIGLVPVAILPELDNYQIVSDYCISADGAVASVCLFSDVPLEEVKTILLDYQSLTSVELLKILLKEYWKLSPKLITGQKGYESHIAGNVAGLVIGDRAFKQRSKSKYIYDLGEAWKNLSGLAFIFAAWVSIKDLSDEFTNRFNDANRSGCEQLKNIIAANPFTDYDLQYYYTSNIIFHPEFNKEAVITLFLKKLKAFQ